MNDIDTKIKERELTLYFGPQHIGMVGNFGITLTVKGDTIQEASSHSRLSPPRIREDAGERALSAGIPVCLSN